MLGSSQDAIDNVWVGKRVEQGRPMVYVQRRGLNETILQRIIIGNVVFD